MVVWLAKNFCSKSVFETAEHKDNFQVSLLYILFRPLSKEGADLEKPKVIWFQLHAVKIEFVARN